MSLLGSRVDKAELHAAVGAVPDPEIGRPLAELGMLDDVEVTRSGRVTVRVRLTTPTCPLRRELATAVEAAARSVPGVTAVDVGFTAMTDSQRMRLAGDLRKGGSVGARGFGRGIPVYAVASGKGGVGKSTVTANIAAALAAAGKRVGVLDADVWGYSIPQLFGVRRAPVSLNGLMFPVDAHQVRLMSIGFFVQDDQPVVWRGPMLHKALQQFLDDVHWGELDVLLIDLPPGTGDITISLLDFVPDARILVVTTPQLAAHSVAARVGGMAKDARMPVAGVVENMSGGVFGEGGGGHLARQLDVPLLGQVPLDRALCEAGDAGVPAVLRDPEAESVRELRRVAAALPLPRPSLVGRPLPLFTA